MKNGRLKKFQPLHQRQRNTFVVTYRLVLEFCDVDTDAVLTLDDKVTLYSTDGDRAYERTLSIMDDHNPGNGYLDLVFDGLLPNMNYSCLYAPGQDGEEHHIFKDVPLAELIEDVSYGS